MTHTTTHDDVDTRSNIGFKLERVVSGEAGCGRRYLVAVPGFFGVGDVADTSAAGSFGTPQSMPVTTVTSNSRESAPQRSASSWAVASTPGQ